MNESHVSTTTRRYLWTQYFALSLLLLTRTAAGETAGALPSVLSDEELRQILVERVDVRHTNVGIVVGVITPQGRRVVSYGVADRSDSRPLDGDTIFEIGSVTKVFTSLLLADMVQRGEVVLSDPVEKHLPEGVKSPRWKDRSIALVDLATHTSGLPFWPSDAETEREFFLKETDAQVTFQTDDQGRATGLVLHIWGFHVPAPRIEPVPK